MAEQEDNTTETTEQPTPETEAEAPAAADDVSVEATPAEVLAEKAEAPAAAAEPQEPAEQLSPKERRRRGRSAHAGDASPQRGVEERIAERAEKRRKNAEVRRRYRARSREKRRTEGPREGTPPAERTGTGSPRVRQGIVVSDGGDKSITVRIDFARRHRTYGKIVRTSSKLHAHDEQNEANTGDTVRVVESRPLSRTKRWRLVEVVDRAR